MPDEFQHLELPLLREGKAKLKGFGKLDPQTIENKKNRVEHAELLRSKANHLNQYWKKVREDRENTDAPDLPDEIPLLLKVDPSLDLEGLISFYGFEIVSEQEDGFILVATGDTDFSKFLETVTKFSDGKRGGATAASIHDISDSEDQMGRLQRILSEDIFKSWPDIDGDSNYTVDIGVECVGQTKIPKLPVKRKSETPTKFRNRMEKFSLEAKTAYIAWDEIKVIREGQLEEFVAAYEGESCTLIDGDTDGNYPVPDSFTGRIKINGKGLTVLVFNFPFIFEVSSPDVLDEGRNIITDVSGEITATFEAPDALSPAICIIDSGIQEAHPLLKETILEQDSTCYLPGQTDVSDQVTPHGHGTRVAGAVLFPNTVPRTGQNKLKFWLQNARVLDANNLMPSSIFPPLLLKKIIAKFHVESEKKTRIFNHSISSSRPCPTRHMSSWAAAIDDLSFQNDVLFVQAAGNLPDDSQDIIQKGVVEHLTSGTNYPDYLTTSSSRIANPAQSFPGNYGGISCTNGLESGWTRLFCSTAGRSFRVF